MNARVCVGPVLMCFLAACGGGASDIDEGDVANGIGVLGNENHTVSGVLLSVVADSSDDIEEPMDVEFNPVVPGQAWVVSRSDERLLIIDGIGTAEQDITDFDVDRHFLAQPIGLAFSDDGYMASIHDTDQPTQGAATPADFMGPTLWPATIDDCETPSNAQAGSLEDETWCFAANHMSHLDMLHNSPLGGGIEWEEGNTYWVMDGDHGSLTRYRFNDDHGPGGTDHTDGEIQRFVNGDLDRNFDLPSQMVLDHATGLLYVADTGNSRIMSLDTNAGTQGNNVGPNYDGCPQYKMDDVSLQPFLTADNAALGHPSGMALHDGVLYVTDSMTSILYAYDLVGNELDWVDLGRGEGALAGIDVDPATGDLYIADREAAEILRLQNPG